MGAPEERTIRVQVYVCCDRRMAVYSSHSFQDDGWNYRIRYLKCRVCGQTAQQVVKESCGVAGPSDERVVGLDRERLR